jgi:YidC/Oxa1 family membrane protein insertase
VPASAKTVEAPATAVQEEKTYTVSTDLLEAVFTNKGGDLQSLKLKKHKDATGEVNLIIPGQDVKDAFTISFGDRTAAARNDIFDVRLLDDKTIEFSKIYAVPVAGRVEPSTFTLRKTFGFKDGEYLFGLAVTLENSANEVLPLDKGGYAYTLSFAPQIGPKFNPLSKNSDTRTPMSYWGGKKHDEKLKNNTPASPKEQPSWVGIGGKYFAFLASPGVQTFTTTLESTNQPGFGQTTRIDFSRPAIKTSKQTDEYYFYFGPRTNTELAKYHYADKNAFNKADMHFEDAVRGGGLRWLEDGIKFFLNIFYKLIPNYGIAIILVTILVKAILFPLTKKGSVSSARMQEIQPKMTELQAKYKNNPQKLNQEMAELYKKEGANPMSGCLPLLIQFPIFIAMYNLFNNHFDLRGAMFIAGWIPDLSMPETVWNFAPFKIPFLGWSDLRLLPIIYLVSQLVYGKFTQQPATGQNATQMKLMMFGMPIVFFFILYDVPAGLLVYWIVSNLLTIAQQLVINDMLKKRKRHLALVKK